MGYSLVFGDLLPYWDVLLHGLIFTIVLTVVSTVAGIALGTAGAAGRSFGPRWLDWLIGAFYANETLDRETSTLNGANTEGFMSLYRLGASATQTRATLAAVTGNVGISGAGVGFPIHVGTAFNWSWLMMERSTNPAGVPTWTRRGNICIANTLKRSVRNIVNAHNDCGHADKVGATAVYQGTTDRTPAPTDKGTCDSASQDGKNVIGFGRLPAGIAGLTCVWSIGDRIIEADIKLDRRAKWAKSLCAGPM